jgi:lysozyme family protein
MDRFDICHAITAKWEGGWSNHPSDHGGKEELRAARQRDGHIAARCGR